MAYRYVPLLRSKSGEAVALQNLSAQAKARMLPIIHLTQDPPATFVPKLAACWRGLPTALDGLFNLGVTGTTMAFTGMFNALGGAGIPVLPVIECAAAVPYLNAVGSLVGRYAPGLVVKAPVRHLPNVQEWVVRQNWQPNIVDLIVDAERVAAYDSVQFGNYILHVSNVSIPMPSPWRSVTLASAAAPRDYSTFGVGRATAPRLDWRLWNHVAPQVQFPLDYGDYGVSDPDLTEPPGIAMARATISVRYSIDDDWIIRKGYPITGARGRPQGQQYHAHATALTTEAAFGGVAGCWADGRIQQIVAGAVGSGNRTTWVEIAVNRHLSLVADRLP